MKLSEFIKADKQPYRIKLIEREFFVFAGLWSKWVDPEEVSGVEVGSKMTEYFSFSIITTIRLLIYVQPDFFFLFS